ncbi:hypothetical protein COOONC_25499, partial [Cooperia oncophora]
AFEALLEPAPVLICPICDLPQKTSDVACVFGCMFNDLDLVDHLERDHSDILADDMVCDFSDPRYLFTTFQEKRTQNNPSSNQRSSEQTGGADGDDDRHTIVLSDGEERSGSSSPGDSGMEHKYSPKMRPNAVEERLQNENYLKTTQEIRGLNNSSSGNPTSGVVDMETNVSQATEPSHSKSAQVP